MKEKGLINKVRFILRGLTFRLVSGVVMLMLMFGVILGIVSYLQFRDSITRQYAERALNTARVASAYVDVDRIDEWMENGGDDDDYRRIQSDFETLCNNVNAITVYVIRVNRVDYDSFTIVFDALSKNSPYNAYTIGSVHLTSSDKYKVLYRDIYEKRVEQGYVMRNANETRGVPHVTGLVPLKDEKGTVRAIVLAQHPMAELVEGWEKYRSGISFLMFTTLVVVSIIVFWYLRIMYVTPLKKIAGETVRFAAHPDIAGTDNLTGISRIREIDELAVSIKKMESDTISYVDRVMRLNAEKERMGAQLNVAREIQARMMPAVFPPFPDRDEFDIYATMTPALEVGGDFYDYFMPDDEHLVFAVGDVSGKGMPAALFMVMAKTLIRDNLLSIDHMGASAGKISTVLFQNNGAGLFVTCFMGILDIRTGLVTYVNAGHNPPVRIRGSGESGFVREKTGQLVLAGWPDYTYRENTLQLEEGDSLFLYTDGVTEAENENGEYFGEDRLLEMFSSDNFGKYEPKDGIAVLEKKIGGFCGTSEQFDDTTMLMIKFRRKAFMKEEKLFPARVDEIPGARSWLREYLGSFGASEMTLDRIAVAFEEIFVNISSYGYDDAAPEERKDIRVQIEVDENKWATVILRDHGVNFDPAQKGDLDIDAPLQERPVGGLGIFLATKMTDRFSHENIDGINITKLEIQL